MHRMHKAHWNRFTKKSPSTFFHPYTNTGHLMYTQVFFCLHTIANARNRNLYAPNVQPNHTWHIRLRSEMSSRDECCCEILTTTARTMKIKTIHTPKKPQSECAMRVKVDGVAKATSMKIGRTRQKLNWINVSLIRNESLEHTMCLFLFFRSRSFSILPFCNHSRCNINGIALFAMQLFQQKHHHHPVFLVHKPSPICLAICVYMDFYCCYVCNIFFSFFVYFFFSSFFGCLSAISHMHRL